jgi:hypothetical protein
VLEGVESEASDFAVFMWRHFWLWLDPCLQGRGFVSLYLTCWVEQVANLLASSDDQMPHNFSPVY